MISRRADNHFAPLQLALFTKHSMRWPHTLIAGPPTPLLAKCPRLLRDDDFRRCLTASGVDRLVEPMVDQRWRDGRRAEEPAVVLRACSHLLPERRDRRRRRRADKPVHLAHGTEQDESQNARGGTGEQSGNRCVIPREDRTEVEPHDHSSGTGGEHPCDRLAPWVAVGGKVVPRGPQGPSRRSDVFRPESNCRVKNEVVGHRGLPCCQIAY